MPLYGNDLFSACEGYSDAVTLGYVRALWHYWHHAHCDGLPDDDDYLRRVCRCEAASWVRTKGIIFGQFFKLAGSKWHQTRARDEWTAALERRERFVEASKRGVQRRIELGQIKPSVEPSVEPSDSQKPNRRSNSGSTSPPLPPPLPPSVPLPSSSPSPLIANRGDGAKGVALKLADLLCECSEVLGEKEMKVRHKRWLKRAESEPDKFQRVIADVKVQKRERQLQNAGAYAEDLWKRFT